MRKHGSIQARRLDGRLNPNTVIYGVSDSLLAAQANVRWSARRRAQVGIESVGVRRQQRGRAGRMSSQIIGRNPFNADRFRKVLDHVPDNLLRQGFLEVSQRFPLLPSTPSGCVQLDRRRDLRLDRVAGVAAR